MHDMLPHLIQTDFPAIERTQLNTLQANLGYRCNQSCLHCHVAASPKRTEEMGWDTMQLMLDFIEKFSITTLDVTGGAPEMNQHFKRLIVAARKLGVKIIDRCNLTILCEPGYEDFAEFLAENEVEVVASLPCYLEDNVDAQRGDGVFQASIQGLKQLNQLGYAQAGSGLVLNLVYNPQGAVLPPEQQALEADYKHELNARYGVQFSNLFTLANLPIQRFGSTLISKNTFIPYMELLRNSFNAATLDNLMCRSLISVGWQGYVHDCDFNQQLKMPIGGSREPVHLASLLANGLQDKRVRIGDHCYGCTAGQGSSCGGALS